MNPRKTNRKGRVEGYEHFTKMFRRTLDTPAWRALSRTAQALYPFIQLEWKGPQNNNNGRIRFSARQAAKALGCGVNTAARAFHDLQAKGFIVVTDMGALGVGGMARGPSYELTDIPLPNEPVGRRRYRDWKHGEDFHIAVHHANNPHGENGRIPSRKSRRSHHRDEDGSSNPVIKIETARHRFSDVRRD